MKYLPSHFINLKNKEKITMLTCYDAATARLLEEAGIDIILVGDSCANVFLGANSTRDISINEMAYHVRAVSNGAKNTHIIGDIDFKSCKSVYRAVKSAKMLLKAGAHSVKIEGYPKKIISAFKKHQIPFVGHVGLLPQTASQFSVHGKSDNDANNIIEEARKLEEAGAFLIVIECVPTQLGEKLQKTINVPIIGIGAGKNVDGQVLVINDMIGLTQKSAKFVRTFGNISSEITRAAKEYIKEVKGNSFPNEQESYH